MAVSFQINRFFSFSYMFKVKLMVVVYFACKTKKDNNNLDILV